MKHVLIKIIIFLFAVNISQAQAWMTSLEIAQKLALVQNKMVLMVWEETTKYPYPVFVNNENGKIVVIKNLFEDETISPLIWEYFVPVIVNENQYADLYESIKGKRKLSYIDKFNDDSIKIMDANGTIINALNYSETYQNITTLIKKYALNTTFITPELKAYKKEQNFYSTYFLASKYLDYAVFSNAEVRPNILSLYTIYLDEAKDLLEKSNDANKTILTQRIQLLELQHYLISNKPKKVLRQLKKIKPNATSNTSVVAFLYYTAYKILKDQSNATQWQSKISSVNLRKAQLIINLNY